MRINWLGTTAIAFVIGTGAVMAQQSELPQKREENPHVRTAPLPSKEVERPAAREQRPAERPQERAAKPPAKQSEELPGRGERRRARRGKARTSRKAAKPSSPSNRSGSWGARSNRSRTTGRLKKGSSWTIGRSRRRGRPMPSSRVSASRDATATIRPPSPPLPRALSKAHARAIPSGTESGARIPPRRRNNRRGGVQHHGSPSTMSSVNRSSSGCARSEWHRTRISMSG